MFTMARKSVGSGKVSRKKVIRISLKFSFSSTLFEMIFHRQLLPKLANCFLPGIFEYADSDFNAIFA
jgi:hypothetical protein